MHPYGFAKSERLLKRADFVRLGTTGTTVRSPHFIVIVERDVNEHARIGITASRKAGNSVQRNRIKRLVRESFRLNKPLFMNVNCNIIARKGADRLTLDEVTRELTRALTRGNHAVC